MAQCLTLLERRYGIRPTGIIHVGANTGQEVAVFRDSGIRPVVLIEPLAGPFGQLVRAIGGTPGFYPLNTCLSDAAGRTVDFHVASNGGQSSSYLKPAAHLAIRPDITFDRTETMVTDTLDRAIGSLCREHGLRPGSFDYIGLDTQGTEMDILRGSPEMLGHARYVFTEVNFGNLYEADTGLYRAIELMRGWGFDLYHLLMTTRGWGDALFMRRPAVGQAPRASRTRRLARAARRLRDALGVPPAAHRTEV
jgi:FkbM family methyltransferase